MVQTVIEDVSGWLPFGSNDDSVLLQADLKSLASIQAIPAALQPELGNALTTFDSVKGMNPNGSGGYEFRDLVDNARLDDCGQMTIEIEREWATYNDPANGSVGHVPPITSEGVISMLATSGGAMSILKKSPTGNLWGSINNTGVARSFKDGLYDGGLTVGVNIHSAGKNDPFIKINCGWWGGKAGGVWVMRVDGLIIAAGLRNGASNTGLFARAYIGSDRAFTNTFISYFVRNFQLSTRSPMVPVHPQLRNVSVLSDSLFTSDAIAVPHRDVITSFSIRREIEKNNFRIGTLNTHTDSGFTIQDTGSGDLSDHVAEIVAQKPQIILLRGGTNDAVQGLITDATWETNLKSLVTSLLAITETSKVIVGTIPSLIGNSTTNTAAAQASRALGNTYIRALPAWNSNVVVAEIDRALGEEPNTFIGQLNGLFGDLHLAPLGHYKSGEEYAKQIIGLLG